MRKKAWTPKSGDEDTEKKDTAMAPRNTLPNASKIGPDRCRSWFIAALCFVVNLLFSSFFRCGGLFFTSMMSTYQATRAQAAMPLGAYCGFVNLSGLAAGVLIHSLGMRISTALGGLLMSAGCLASAFATGIPFLVGSVGVVIGSGHGILLSCVIVTVNEYFDRRRGMALGINMAGAPAASFIFPKIFDYCLAEYGLHGTFALLGALLLNIGPISLFFRKPPWMREECSKISKVSRKGSSDADDQKGKEAADRSGCITTTLQPLLGRNDDPDDSVRDNDNILFTSTKRPTIIRLSRYPISLSLNDLADSRRRQDMLETLETSVTCAENSKAMSWKRDEQGNIAVPHVGMCRESCRACVTRASKGGSFQGLSQGNLNPSKLHQARRRVSLEDKSVKVTGRAVYSIKSTSIKDSMPIFNGTIQPLESGTEGMEDETIPLKSDHCVRTLKSPEDVCDFRDSVKERRTRSLLRSARDVLSTRRFYAHMFSYFSFCFFLDTFLAVALDCAVDNGISRVDAAHVLTFFSVTDTAGRLLIPLITDYNIASPLGVMTLSYFLVAVIGTTMPHAQNDAVFWILVVSLGLPVGYVMVAMSETIACDVGVRNLPMAYGFVAAVTALGAFMRPLFIGYFRDANGSYGGLFHFMGGMVFTSVLLTGWLWASRSRNNKLQRKTSTARRTEDPNVWYLLRGRLQSL